MKLAAIDIGSNSIHLVIVRAMPGQHLEIIDREKDMMRLGAGTLTSHRLAPDAIDRALAVLGRFKQVAEANQVEHIIATATAAVREAHNADDFVAEVSKQVGLNVQVLPGVEEARLIALAVSEVTDFHNRRALIIDIGGGSTELIITRGGEPELLQSVRLGAVRLTDKFVTTDPISNYERDRLVANIRTDLTRVVSQVKQAGYDFVVGTSGTILNLAEAVHTERTGESPGEADFRSFHYSITLNELRALNRRLASMTQAQRRTVPGLEKRRADIIVAGGLLLETILSEVRADSLTTCDWSLREGVLLNYLREARTTEAVSTSPETLFRKVYRPDMSSVRTRSVFSVARRYNYDAAHSTSVAYLAGRIFDDTRELHELGELERGLLEYAALLHDIGYHVAQNNHHHHSLYLIKNSDMPGFTGPEIATMATIARYHRGSMPTKSRDPRERREHDEFRSLSKKQQQTVKRLAAILRIADALDRSHKQIISDVRCVREGRRLTFYVTADRPCELELWSAQRKAEWLGSVFNVEVSFVPELAAAAPAASD